MTTRRRITVQLDEDLYTRLRTFAKGRSHGHEIELSAIVREALEHYITPTECLTRSPTAEARTRPSASKHIRNTG